MIGRGNLQNPHAPGKVQCYAEAGTGAIAIRDLAVA